MPFSIYCSPLTGSLLLWVHSFGKGRQLPIESCSPSSWRVRHQVNQENLVFPRLPSCSPSVSVVLFVSALSSPIPQCYILPSCGDQSTISLCHQWCAYSEERGGSIHHWGHRKRGEKFLAYLKHMLSWDSECILSFSLRKPYGKW